MQNLLLAEWLQRMAAWRRENMQCECLPELHMLQASAESCSRSYTPPRHDDRLDAGHKNSGACQNEQHTDAEELRAEK